MIDWNNVQEKVGGNFKKYFADGPYKAKCNEVEIKEVGQNGSVIMRFKFEETDAGQYPTADHWLSFKNEAWRQWHNKCLMVVLGATEDAAKKAVEMAESKSGKENIIKGYETCYKKLLAKKPEVEIEVYTDEKGYARAEFRDRTVAMPHDTGEQPKDTSGEPVLEGAEEITDEADLSNLPF